MNIQKYHFGNCGLMREADRSMYKNIVKEYEEGIVYKDSVSNSRIDFSRTHLNYNLCPHEQYTDVEIRAYNERVRGRRLKNAGIRKDITFGGICLTIPEDYDGNQKAFFQAAYDSLKKELKVTDQDVVSCYVHYDENRPHMHFYFMLPEIEKFKKDKKTGKEVPYKTVNWDVTVSKSVYNTIHSKLQDDIKSITGIEPHLLNDNTLGVGNLQCLNKGQKNLLIEMETLRKERQDLYAEIPGIEDAIKKNMKEADYYFSNGKLGEAFKEMENEKQNKLLLTDTEAQIKEKTVRIHEIQALLNSEYRTRAQTRVITQLSDMTNADEELYIAREKMKDMEQKLKKVSAELVSEKEKNKNIPDKNILGRDKMMKVSAEEYRSWQKSAESKEEHDARERQQNNREEALDIREKNIESEVSQRIQMRMPEAITTEEKRLEEYKEQLEQKQQELLEKENQLHVKSEEIESRQEQNQKMYSELNSREKKLDEKESSLNNREKELDEKEKRFDNIVLEKAKELAEKMIEEYIKPLVDKIILVFKHSIGEYFTSDSQLEVWERHKHEFKEAERKDIRAAIATMCKIDDIKDKDVDEVLSRMGEGANPVEAIEEAAKGKIHEYMHEHKRSHRR